jgi:hypothetical protein
MREDAFKEDRPQRERAEDFAGRGRVIVSAQSEVALEPEEQRQGAGDEQHVAKILGEERRGRAEARRQPETIGSIGQPAREEERIAEVAEGAHRSEGEERDPESESGGEGELGEEDHR